MLYVKLALFFGLAIVTFRPDVISASKPEYDRKFRQVLQDVDTFIERSTKRKKTLNRIHYNLEHIKQEVEIRIRGKITSATLSALGFATAAWFSGGASVLLYAGYSMTGLGMLSSFFIQEVDTESFQRSATELKIWALNVESDYNNIIEQFNELLNDDTLTPINLSFDNIETEEFGQDTSFMDKWLSAVGVLSTLYEVGEFMDDNWPQTTDAIKKIGKKLGVSEVIYVASKVADVVDFLYNINVIIARSGADADIAIILNPCIAKTKELMRIITKLCDDLEYRMDTIMEHYIAMRN